MKPLGLLGFVILLAACASVAEPPSSPPATPHPMPTADSPTTTNTEPPESTTTTLRTTTTTTTTSPPAPLASQTVVLDPGHNGLNWAHPEEIGRTVDIGVGTKACNTTGTSTADGYPEARFTWQVARLTKERLEQLGATVILTREDNEGWGPCITERASVGNQAGAGAVISIHADGGPESGRGFHVIHPAVIDGFTDDIAADSLRLARAMHTAYLDTGMPVADYIGEGGFSERGDLGGLVLSDVPVVFLEAGNMRNAADAALLTDDSFQAAIVDSIARALVDFFND